MAVGGGRVAGVNMGNNLVGTPGSHAAGCLERSGGSNNLDRGAAISSNVGPCRESNSNRGEGERVDRASADRDRMAGLDRCVLNSEKKLDPCVLLGCPVDFPVMLN